jgi:hypothetical protein
VVNLVDITGVTIQAFKQAFIAYFQQHENGNNYELTDHDIRMIRKLQNEKFEQWKWNIGRSPDYTMQVPLETGKIVISVHRGIVVDVDTPDEWVGFGEYIKNKPHKFEMILAGLKSIGNEFQSDIEEWVYRFF